MFGALLGPMVEVCSWTHVALGILFEYLKLSEVFLGVLSIDGLHDLAQLLVYSAGW